MISFVVFVRTKNTQKSFVLIVSWISQKYLKNEENAKKEKSFVEEREIIKWQSVGKYLRMALRSLRLYCFFKRSLIFQILSAFALSSLSIFRRLESFKMKTQNNMSYHTNESLIWGKEKTDDWCTCSSRSFSRSLRFFVFFWISFFRKDSTFFLSAAVRRFKPWNSDTSWTEEGTFNSKIHQILNKKIQTCVKWSFCYCVFFEIVLWSKIQETVRYHLKKLDILGNSRDDTNSFQWNHETRLCTVVQDELHLCQCFYHNHDTWTEQHKVNNQRSFNFQIAKVSWNVFILTWDRPDFAYSTTKPSALSSSLSFSSLLFPPSSPLIHDFKLCWSAQRRSVAPYIAERIKLRSWVK